MEAVSLASETGASEAAVSIRDLFAEPLRHFSQCQVAHSANHIALRSFTDTDRLPPLVRQKP